MKTKQFETHQGKFVIVDENLYLVNNRGWYSAYLFEDMKTKLFDYELYFGLKTATEEQAEMVVDSSRKNKMEYDRVFRDYQSKYKYDYPYSNALESLHSLIRSLGIHLYENPIKHPSKFDYFPQGVRVYEEQREKYNQAESQTFYNPFIFKIV